MGRTGFTFSSAAILLGLPLLYVLSAIALRDRMASADCSAISDNGMTCVALTMAGFAAAPVVIVLAGIGMGIVVLLRARATSLSALWGFVVMVLTVQAMALLATLFVIPGGIGADPLAAALRSASLWLLGAFLLFLLLVPEWRGPAPLDIGLSLIAALAAIIVIAVGHSMDVPIGYFLGIQEAIANTLAYIPNVDWIALGIFVTALVGICAGRMLPEAE
jgi:hypothetical protein